jgi:hypothetical protein
MRFPDSTVNEDKLAAARRADHGLLRGSNAAPGRRIEAWRRIVSQVSLR